MILFSINKRGMETGTAGAFQVISDTVSYMDRLLWIDRVFL